MLERRGVISGYEGSKPRQVLITMADLPRVLSGAEAQPAGRAGAGDGRIRPRSLVRSTHLRDNRGSMETGIGPTLRETRIRRRIDLAAVEGDTKIRVRYLRALENEEWDVLPGGAYTRSFIRTYANYLGLDAERLSDEYRRTVEEPDGERPREAAAGPVRPPAAGGGGSGFQISRGALAALISAGLIVILIGIGLAGGGGGGDSTGNSPQRAVRRRRRSRRHRPRRGR